MNTYNYNLSEFLNNILDIPRLTQEIQNNDILTIALDYINLKQYTCTITFKAELSIEQHEELTYIVNNHSGESSSEIEITDVHIMSQDPRRSSLTTGGHFCGESFHLHVPAAIGSYDLDISFPFPIALLSGEWVSTAAMNEDVAEICLYPNTIIGAIIAPTVIGEDIIYVSPTVIDNIQVGFHVSIGDIELGRVYEIGENYIKIDRPLDTIYPAMSYINMCIKIINNYLFNSDTVMSFGKDVPDSEILPANTTIKVTYNNLNGLEKLFTLYIAYLY